MEMALGGTTYGANLPAALRKGRITEAQLDDAVRPILATKIQLGLFEHPYVDEAVAKQTIEAPDHRIEARKAAERSAVLLRNEGGLLPLKVSAYRKIALITALSPVKPRRMSVSPAAIQMFVPAGSEIIGRGAPE